jgi:hypothetical protein
MPRIYSYIIPRDFGFAPNPFFGWCTLATCKPKIRESAQVGDWVVGTGSKGVGLSGLVVYAMQVTEALTFDNYWIDDRFRSKKPNLRGSLKQRYGDNIYWRADPGSPWNQLNSHHSMEDGTANKKNLDWDTGVDRVLVSNRFVYWGGTGCKPPPPADQICHNTQGHRVNHPDGVQDAMLAWLESQKEWGYLGDPYEFRRHARVRAGGSR